MPPEIRVDLRDEAVLIPEGLHCVRVEEVALRETREGGSHYLNFRLAIAEGEHEDAVLWAVGSLRKDMRRMLRSMFRALGVGDGDLTIQTEEGDDSDQIVVQPDFIGREALAQVVHDEYMGETRAKVKRLLPLEAVA